MPQRKTHRRLIAAVPLVLLASLVLAACGSSSSSSTSTSAAAASSSGTGATGTTGARRGGARFAALRECLEKNGITLPARKAGARPQGATGGTRPPGGAGGVLGGGGAGPTLPKGVTRAQYEAALKKCGGSNFFGGGAGARRNFNSPERTAALDKFASCMRQHGVNLPAPNTTGTGPVFDTKSINTTSAAFRTAETACSKDLAGAFRRRAGAGGGGPQTG
jgi:hypothetical protein